MVFTWLSLGPPEWKCWLDWTHKQLLHNGVGSGAWCTVWHGILSIMISESGSQGFPITTVNDSDDFFFDWLAYSAVIQHLVWPSICFKIKHISETLEACNFIWYHEVFGVSEHSRHLWLNWRWWVAGSTSSASSSGCLQEKQSPWQYLDGLGRRRGAASLLQLPKSHLKCKEECELTTNRRNIWIFSL